MKIKSIEKARDDYGMKIIIRPESPERAETELYSVEGVPIDKIIVRIEKARKKRSLDANSYMWILCDKIAEKLGGTKSDIYREAVRQVGVFTDIAVVSHAAGAFVKTWQSRGIGWIAEIYQSKMPGCLKVRTYYGSSVYDSRQMSRLIDYLVEEAGALGIETMTPDEIERLNAAWCQA